MELPLNDVLKIVEVVSIIGGGAVVVFKLGKAINRFEETAKMQGEQIDELKEETKKMGAVLTTLAVQDSRLDRMETDLHELRHGKGWVNPLSG